MQYEEKVIPNFPNYTIDTNCVVRNRTTGREVKSHKNPQGYMRLTLYNEGYPSSVSVHRIFMETFNPIPNMDEMVVNHIDGVRDNNVPSNLEWLTNGDNIRYGHILGLPPTDRRVDVMDVSSGEVTSYNSFLDASRVLGIHDETIISRLNNPNNIVYPGGYRLKRPDDEWLYMEHIALEDIYNPNRNPIDVFNFYTRTEYHLDSQTQACLITDFSPGLISEEVNSNAQRVLPGLWVVKHPEVPWRVFGDPWLEFESASISRPVICTYPNSHEEIFESLTDCANAIGMGKTSVYYRLNNNILTPGRNGYSFEYYSDRVRRLSNQAL